jgi:hypothetical protein
MTPKLAQRPKLIATNRVCRRFAVLGPPDMKRSGVKIDLRPFEVTSLGSPQAMSVDDQNHRGIAVRVPAPLGRCDQLVNLGRGQVFAGTQFSIGNPPRCN